MKAGKNVKNECYINPGNVSCCSLGGIGYGIYGFAANTGVPQSFVGWLNKKGHPYGRMLSKFASGTREFSCCWQYIGEHDPEEFKALQHEYVRNTYYVPAVENLCQEFNLDIRSRDAKLQELVWAVAVEYGPTAVGDLMREVLRISGLTHLNELNDHDLRRSIEHIFATSDWAEASDTMAAGVTVPWACESRIDLESA
ncbi:MAG TPA: hypothetical protein PKA28_18290 [Methylomusa anaerophila]|uniref:Type VI secretion system spike protein VgrG3-like C-terminal domain-containing protein n=1 Tax=Methylomusa anaerophila TaxID=1930071 RepID=A0A348AH49_9FIRM|nr:hypothetical protein [Methylomusa anaerophila]BBB90397.1 hypothetical protein MAMMFC1_01047 [Methylomusa anaerophila]HML90389.1 hypothetical protein [Methylomusa anaerophila]